MNQFSEKLSTLRKKQGYTQVELAEQLNISAQAVSKWELGTSYPDVTLLPKIAKLLETTVDYLLNDDSEPIVVYQSPEQRKKIEDLFLKIRVIDGGTKVNVNLPLAFIKMGAAVTDTLHIKGTNVGEMMKGIDFNQILDMVEKGILGKIVEVEGEDGEYVIISVE